MTTGDLLLKAILANPGDDAARLVYADWLEENGQPERAEFIRLEIEKSRTGHHSCPVEPPTPGRLPLGCGVCEFCCLDIDCERFHECGLLWAAVAGPLPPISTGYAHTSRHPSLFTEHARWPSLHTARGFVESVTCPADLWLRWGDAIRKAHPVTRVTLTTWPGGPDGAPNWWRVGVEWTGEPYALTFRTESRGTACRGILETRWEGVAFDLPPLDLVAPPVVGAWA